MNSNVGVTERMLAALIIAAVLFPGLAHAQAVAVTSAEGRVLDKATGAPVPGARVELLPHGRLSLTTADGRWRFDGLEPADATIRINAEGFETASVSIAMLKGAGVQDVSLARRPYHVHESVTVTAARNAVRGYDVPRSMSVLTSADIDRQMPRTAPEAIADVAGVFVQKTNHGSGSPFLRGLVGNQVLVLIDGIRLNNATFRYGPNQYLATIDPALIDRIEVLRGSGSVLYGSDAIGGVINIITRQPTGVGQPLAVGGRVAAKVMTSGMERSGRFDFNIGGRRGGVVSGLSLRNFGDLRAGRGIGVEAPSGYDEVAGDMRAELPMRFNQRLTFGYQHHRQDDVPRYDQVAQRGFARYAFDPQVRQLAYARYERSSTSRWATAIRATTSLHRTTEQREYQRQQSDILTIERDRVLVAGFSAEVQSHVAPSLQLVSGLDYYADSVGSGRRDIRTSTSEAIHKRGLYPDGATADSLALFTHATWTGGRWQVDSGLRVGSIQVSAPDPVFGSARIAPKTATGSGSAMFAVSDGIRIFGSISQGFRAPNIDDLATLGPFDFGVEIPSPHLEPETSVTVEGGVKIRSRVGGASLSIYRTALDQLIDRVPGVLNGSPFLGDQAVYQKANVGSAFVRGAEVDGEIALMSSATLAGFVTYTYGQITSRNEPLRRVPPLNGRVALRLLPRSSLWVEGAIRFATRQDRLAAGDLADHRIPAGGTAGWNTLGMSAGYRISESLDLIGALQNVLDEPYRTHGSGVDGMGRSAWLGLSARLR